MIELELSADGGIAMLSDDDIDLRQFGKVAVKRASSVEFNDELQMWEVASAATGKILARAETRKAALAWEKLWYSPTGEGWAELKGGK